MKLWDRGHNIDKQVLDFTVGDDYILDKKLVKFDCLASIAHAKMLGRIGILTKEEVEKLTLELNNLIELDKKGKFVIEQEQEDCHTAIENYLTTKLGDLGKKIHTARSRNDQVLTALRLYYKHELHQLKNLLDDLIRSMTEFDREHGSTEIPGFTHTRKAMPSSVSMWVTAFIDSMTDNLSMLDNTKILLDQSPLGSGAGYGIPLELDREYTADILGFARVQKNPIYVQHSRGKFEAALLNLSGMIMFDLNKISSDLILFSMPEFGFFELPEEMCTGSSIMPHKKNPDVLELIRAKYHVVVTCEYQIKHIIGNLISGYHRDFQLSKAPVINGLEITKSCTGMMTHIFSELKVNAENCQKAMTDELYATAEVYKLVQEGVPFRDAYRRISKRY
ncbi:argininosuccinate lyase [candidate division KSB1 bacterium]|nr:argininosuccinate lyase [candidate division KSB1 bacterium]